MRFWLSLFGLLLMPACSETPSATNASVEPASLAEQAAPKPAAIKTSTILDTSGTPGPQMVRFRQTAPNGLTAEWLSFGATLARLTLPDGTEVAARLSNQDAYADRDSKIGVTIGPVANRIGRGQFVVDGKRCGLTTNEGDNTLHCGPEGMDRLLWRGGFKPNGQLVMRHSQEAGYQGYPAKLDVEMTATLSESALRVTYRASVSEPAPLNLTLHGYWNPAGVTKTPVDGLTMRIPADRYSAVDAELIPTGETPAVAGTPFDYRRARIVGSAPIDHNLLIPGDGLREMVQLGDGQRTITVLSDYPGLQVYTGEGLADGVLSPRSAIAFEPQYSPDAVNQPVDGDDTILRPGEVYEHMIEFRFAGPGLP